VIEYVELQYRGKLIKARATMAGVSTSGQARASNAYWELEVDRVRYEGPESPVEESEAVVRAKLRAWADEHADLFTGARDYAPYKGYRIEPTPKQLRDSGEWTLEVQIARDRGRELNVRMYNARNTFKTQEEAVAQGVRFGQRIIDGEVPGCTVETL